QLEVVRQFVRHRQADHPARVADGEGQQLGRDLLGGDDDVALVLAVLVVHDDHGPAERELLAALRDRRQLGGPAGGGRARGGPAGGVRAHRALARWAASRGGAVARRGRGGGVFVHGGAVAGVSPHGSPPGRGTAGGGPGTSRSGRP